MSLYDCTSLNSIIQIYDEFMVNAEDEATLSENYGGYLRGHKGALLEFITKKIVEICCKELGILDKITIDSKKEKIYDENGNFYNFSIDIQVKYNGKILITIEDKNYCDISMFKRVIFDSIIAQKSQGVNKTFLLQFEDCMNNSGIGSNITYSPTVKFLLNMFNNDKLIILTLLDGQRDSKRPINKIEFAKPLKYDVLYDIKETLKSAIKEEYDKCI